jgi:hypothetical protein
VVVLDLVELLQAKLELPTQAVAVEQVGLIQTLLLALAVLVL